VTRTPDGVTRAQLPAVVDKLTDLVDLLPQDNYRNASVSWTTADSMTLTVSLSTVVSKDEEDDCAE